MNRERQGYIDVVAAAAASLAPDEYWFISHPEGPLFETASKDVTQPIRMLCEAMHCDWDDLTDSRILPRPWPPRRRSMTIALEPCPLCGVHLFHNGASELGDIYEHPNNGCAMQVAWFTATDEWVAKWNRRALPAPIDETIIPEIEGLIDAYWNLAYTEGQQGRTTDTPEGDAQQVRSAITKRLRAFVSPLNAGEERLCIERGMAQWEASMKRPDLYEKARVRGALDAFARQFIALRLRGL
jgi:hypothetical protein